MAQQNINQLLAAAEQVDEQYFSAIDSAEQLSKGARSTSMPNLDRRPTSLHPAEAEYRLLLIRAPRGPAARRDGWPEGTPSGSERRGAPTYARPVRQRPRQELFLRRRNRPALQPSGHAPRAHHRPDPPGAGGIPCQLSEPRQLQKVGNQQVNDLLSHY